MNSLAVKCHKCNKIFTLKDKRTIKKFNKNFICKNCSLNRNRLNNRINLLKDAKNILWKETKQKYGYDYENIKMRSPVICKCTECGNIMELQYRGANDLIKKVSRAKHKKCFKHSKESLNKSINASNKYWSNPKSYELASNMSTKLWKNKNFRNKVIKSLLLKEDNQTFTERSNRSKILWQKENFRSKLLKIMQSQNHRNLKSSLMTNEKREYHRKLMIELWKNESYRLKLSKTAFWNPQPSKLQRKLIPIFNQLNIPWIEEYKIKWWYFDYFLPSKNILIEVQGNYWHNKPDVKSRDKRKFNFVNTKTSFSLIEIWENEFKNSEKLINKISII